MTTGRINQVARDDRTAREARSGRPACDTRPTAHPVRSEPHARARRPSDSRRRCSPKRARGRTEAISPTRRRRPGGQRRRSLPTGRTRSPRRLGAGATGGTSSDHSRRDHQCSAPEAHRILRPDQRPMPGLETRAYGKGENRYVAGGGATGSRRSGQDVERDQRSRPHAPRRGCAAHRESCPKGNHPVLTLTHASPQGLERPRWPRSPLPAQ